MATEQENGDLRRKVESLESEVETLKGELRSSQQFKESFSRITGIYGQALDADLENRRDALKWLLKMYALAPTIEPGIDLLGRMLKFTDPSIDEMWKYTRRGVQKQGNQFTTFLKSVKTFVWLLVTVIVTAIGTRFIEGHGK